jgi:hypothetical protein
VADVIDIRQQRERKQATKGQPTDRGDWLFRLDVYRPEPGTRSYVGSIVDWDCVPDGLEVGDRLRRFAEALEDLARSMRAQAHGMQPDPNGELLAGVMIWESSRVRTWVNTARVGPDADMTWFDRRLDEAKQAARDLAQEEADGR